MTARDIYEGSLVDLNKAHAPALTVEEFVYKLNKAILAFTNERYNFYAVNQQLSDDLRVLVTEATFALTSANLNTDITGDRCVTVELNVDDYLHLLSCDLVVTNDISNLTKKYPVKRLTLDMSGAIALNEYLKPAINRPYHLLLPADTGQNDSTINVYIGDPVAHITPSALRVFYLRLPELATLTDDDVYNLTTAGSTLEWPDYLKNEFVKRVVGYQLEETRDQRASTFPAFNQEILAVPLESMGGSNYPQQQQAQQQTQ